MYLAGDEVTFTASKQAESRLPAVPIHMGVNELAERGGCMILSERPIELGDYPSANVYKILIQSVLNSVTIFDNLFVREKQDGDAYRYGGMTHKLKKLYNDRKLSPEQRRKWPVLCDEDGILWVPGFGERESQNKGNPIYVCYMTEVLK
jgi:tRNA(Ile)-lysidine synthetase-like protein